MTSNFQRLTGVYRSLPDVEPVSGLHEGSLEAVEGSLENTSCNGGEGKDYLQLRIWQMRQRTHQSLSTHPQRALAKARLRAHTSVRRYHRNMYALT